MKINELTQIHGEKVILTPYKEQHVERYHNWMKSEELQLLTASEPLTMQQEYEMQKSWLADDDKLTFIVLCKEEYDNTNNEVESMIGDVNLFMNEPEDRNFAEIEVMTAEKKYRGRGMAKEAIRLMINYAHLRLNLKKVVAKILMGNDASIHLFETLGFKEVSKVEVFKEIKYELILTDAWIEKIAQHPYQEVQIKME